ncbi:MAG: sensor histidine kinase [Planctomycetaceae bacterium]
MHDRFLFRLVAPLVAISLLLLTLGAAAAWNVHRQQAVTSSLVAREVAGMLAVHEVDVGMREIRHQLNQYVRRGDQRYFDRIRPLHSETEKQLEQAKALARTSREQELIGVLDRGYRQFWEEFQQIDQSDRSPEDRRQAFGHLVDETLTNAILLPGQRYIDFNRQVVARTAAASRATSDQMRRAFLLLGVCGGAGGLLAGAGLARALTRSIVQLDVSVRSVAGRLQQVAGPVRISRVGSLRELEAGLNSMERHIAEIVERLEQRELEVVRNEQLAALGQLAAGVAHELRNPLMPIKMLVQAAIDRDDGQGLVGRPLEVVEEEIVRLERSIQSFLDFARPSPPQKASFDLVGLVDQTIELVAGRAARQQVSLLVRAPDEPVLVDADAIQIRQVLLNLLLNAIDALPAGGEAVVEVAAEPACPPVQAGGRAVCRVIDSGTGLPADVLDDVFEPFVTTKETGTGLGLTVCQRIVTAHGGEISARNRSEGGAEFIVRLPLDHRSPALKHVEAAPGRATTALN